jgi:hypothetical protein
MATTTTPPSSASGDRCPETPYKKSDKTDQTESLMDYQKTIFEHFFGDKFVISHSVQHRTFNIRTKTETETNSLFCVKVGVYNDEMYIESLKRCGENTGTTLLRNLLNVAKCLKLTEIFLEDAASITGESCQFSLSLLNILSTGQSWYNKHGFVSPYFDSEKEKNLPFLTMPVKDFIPMALNSYSGLNRASNLFSKLLEEMKDLSDERMKDETQTIQDMVYYVKNTYLKGPTINCSNPVVAWFLSFLIVVRSSRLIQYASTLKYNPVYDEYGEYGKSDYFSGSSSSKGGKRRRCHSSRKLKTKRRAKTKRRVKTKRRIKTKRRVKTKRSTVKR